MQPCAASAAVDLPEEYVTADAVGTAREDVELSPGAVSVVRPQDYAGETQDLPQLLERVPGLHVIRARGRGGYTVASVRGSTSAQVAVFVDGVRMNLGGDAAVDLSAIPVANVERIEVYRGYVPARFGASGMGGVINIVTRDPRAAEGGSTNLNVGFGSYGLWRAAASHSDAWGSGRYFVGVGYESSDGDFKYDNDNGTPYNPADDYRAKRRNNDHADTDVLFKWQDDRWSTRLSWVRNERGLPLPAAGEDKATSVAGATLDTERLEASVGRRHAAGDVAWGWSLEYLHQERRFDDPNDTLGGWGEQHNRYKTERWSVAADASAPIGERQFLELFLNYRDEKLRTTGDIVDALGGLSRMSEQTFEATLQDSIALTPDGSLLLIPSLRWMRDSADDDLTWQIALNKTWPGGWYFKGGYGTYARNPNLYERYGDGAMLRPNEDLRWESGTQWDVGGGWQGAIRGGSLRAGLSYFFRDSDDLIEYVMSGPRHGRYENVGEARVKGVELELAADWDNGWSVFAGGTWMEAEDRTPDSYRTGSPLPNRPEWEALLRVSKRWNRRFSSFAEIQYTGENHYDLAGNVKMDDLTLVNAGLRYGFDNGVELAVGVHDIFDEGPDIGYVPIGDGASRMSWYPLQGRTFYTNLSWTF